MVNTSLKDTMSEAQRRPKSAKIGEDSLKDSLEESLEDSGSN